MRKRLLQSAGAVLAIAFMSRGAAAQTVVIDSTARFQTIDGFGTFAGAEANQAWWQSLYFDDLGASITRMDLTPPFVAKYSNLDYCSPWFGQPAPLSLDNDGQGPDGTRSRQYTSAADYTAAFGGCSAPIAVMGSDPDANAAFLNLGDGGPEANAGVIAQLGQQRGDGFKLYASQWSPAPWLKVSSGNTYSGSAWPLPSAGVSWPYIWGGNFAGGMLDVSDTPLAIFNDGTADTSALIQFGRGLAAFLHGFQTTYGVSFYAVSIQNELNFEEYYNSATYPLSAQYVAALSAARAELDQHADLAAIRIIGPEDLMGGDPYSLWQYGSGATATHKNLQYLATAAALDAGAALGGFAIHGYGADGVSAAGASSAQWASWANGWTSAPAAGLPATAAGFTAYGKPSWMTETSGEQTDWLSASQGDGGFPDQGGFSIAVKIHQALTAGMESAWLYWQLTDGSPSAPSTQALTDSTSLATAPKYNAAKHFFKYIRPGAVRVGATVGGSSTLLASAYVRDSDQSLTVVLVNEATTAVRASLTLPAAPAGLSSLAAYTSADGSLWQSSTLAVSASSATVSLPAYGVVTLYGVGSATVADAGTGPAPDAGTSARDGGPQLDAGGRAPDAGIAPLDAGTVRIDAGAISGNDGGASSASGSTTSGDTGRESSTGCSAGGGVSEVALGLVLLLARRRRLG